MKLFKKRRRLRAVREEINDMSPNVAARMLRQLSRNGFHESDVMVMLCDRALSGDLERANRAGIEGYRRAYARGSYVRHKSTADYEEQDQ